MADYSLEWDVSRLRLEIEKLRADFDDYRLIVNEVLKSEFGIAALARVIERMNFRDIMKRFDDIEFLMPPEDKALLVKAPWKDDNGPAQSPLFDRVRSVDEAGS